jgi:hypothetical protein
MKLLHIRRLIIPVLLLFFTGALCTAQSFERPRSNKRINKVSKKPPGQKRQFKIREPRSVSKAKKKQEMSERKRAREYKAQLEADRKRHLEIQSPDVRERILQNRKNSDINYKVRKKAVAARNKRTGKKYR